MSALFFKIPWVFRAFFYRLFFGRFGFPGYIGPPLFLCGVRRIFIGKKVRIFPHSRLEVHGSGRLLVEDDVAIGQGVHITCEGDLIIGAGCLILPNVLITDIDHEYREVGVPPLRQGNLVRRTVIGSNCMIGMGARIQAGTILGKQCVVGANSVVRGVYPDYSVIVGVPGRVVKRFNQETRVWERC